VITSRGLKPSTPKKKVQIQSKKVLSPVWEDELAYCVREKYANRPCDRKLRVQLKKGIRERGGWRHGGLPYLPGKSVVKGASQKHGPTD